LRSRPAQIHGETDREGDSATTIAELKSEMKALAATVNEQASELRKVSAQLRISNAAAQEIASNSP
jgi:type II secretory pathway component PulM